MMDSAPTLKNFWVHDWRDWRMTSSDMSNFVFLRGNFIR